MDSERGTYSGDVNREVELQVPRAILSSDKEGLKTTFRMLEGDWQTALDLLTPGNGVESEIKDQTNLPSYLRNMLEKGARVFETTKKNILVVHSDKSKKYSIEIQQPKKHNVKIMKTDAVVELQFRPFLKNSPQTLFTVESEHNLAPHLTNEFSGVSSETDQYKVLLEIVENIEHWVKHPPRSLIEVS